jgi:pimeloyl-ACP methyl ester carboxylesterase
MIRSSEPREGEGDSPGPSGDVRARLTLLYEEGRLMADRFRAEVIEHGWHPFVPAEYEQVETVLVSLQRPGMRFLEWGSAMGVITIMADMLGFAAAGIEIDADLARIARELADRFGSAAEFAYDCIKAFSETDFTDDLEAITIPVLFLHGEDDQIVPIENSAHKAVRLVRDGTLKTYPGLSHGLFATHPEVVNRDLLSFVRA